MKTWKNTLSSVDFDSITKKFAELFGSEGNFTLPERFRKGHIARLAEELVSEFRPEDIGLDAATIEECEKNPSRAMEILMKIYTEKPEVLQNSMKRIMGKLQDKFKRGELRMEQIAAEAEELMKEFGDNKALVEIMEQLRAAFGMEDMDLAREAGREGDARRNLVRERLRKKLEKKKAGGGKK